MFDAARFLPGAFWGFALRDELRLALGHKSGDGGAAVEAEAAGDGVVVVRCEIPHAAAATANYNLRAT